MSAHSYEDTFVTIRLTHSKRDISTENIHNVLAPQQSTALLGLWAQGLLSLRVWLIGSPTKPPLPGKYLNSPPLQFITSCLLLRTYLRVLRGSNVWSRYTLHKNEQTFPAFKWIFKPLYKHYPIMLYACVTKLILASMILIMNKLFSPV